jgi:hypothetical protein
MSRSWLDNENDDFNYINISAPYYFTFLFQ